MDTMMGADQAKLDEFVKTALLIEQTQHDESIMETVLSQSEEMIHQGKYKEAE